MAWSRVVGSGATLSLTSSMYFIRFESPGSTNGTGTSSAGGGVSSACGANAAREILMDLKRPSTVPEDDCYDE